MIGKSVNDFSILIWQVPLAKLITDDKDFVQVLLEQITWYHQISQFPKDQSYSSIAFVMQNNPDHHNLSEYALMTKINSFMLFFITVHINYFNLVLYCIITNYDSIEK